jgi:enamine deaminase RidA (YjgF/YER057c/UK114 family)
MPQYKAIPNRADTHPFSWCLHGDEWVFVTGLGGHHEDGSIDDDVVAQTRQAITMMDGLLKEAGSSLSEIVWFRPLVTKREYAFEMDSTFREMLPEPRPASGALIICELADPQMKMEIEAIAQRGAQLSV